MFAGTNSTIKRALSSLPAQGLQRISRQEVQENGELGRLALDHAAPLCFVFMISAGATPGTRSAFIYGGVFGLIMGGLFLGATIAMGLGLSHALLAPTPVMD
jgi:hypothetical protein